MQGYLRKAASGINEGGKKKCFYGGGGLFYVADYSVCLTVKEMSMDFTVKKM